MIFFILWLLAGLSANKNFYRQRKMSRRWKDWDNKFGIKDVVVWNPPGDGNCLFSSISEAVDPHLKCTIEHLRYYAALQILREDKESVDLMINVYRDEVERKQFCGAWNPLKCTTPQELSEAIIEPVYSGKGFDFQGDDIVLNMLSKILHLDIVVFDQEKSFGYTCVGGGSQEKNKYTIFLLLQTRGCKHYQALGVCRTADTVQSLFESNNLPANFKNYIDMVDAAGEKRQQDAKEAKIKKQIAEDAAVAKAIERELFRPSATLQG